MAKLFKTAFAYQGTKEQLPDGAQPDGKASFAEGFTDDYTLDYGDADARDIAQSELNGIFHDITEAIGELQQYGVAVWQSDMVPIAKYSLVFHDDKLWQAKKNTSATPAAGADWQQVDIAGIVSQLGTLDLNDYATKTYVDSAVNGLASVSYVDSAVATKATASVVNAQLAGKLDKTDVAQESGQSTTKVMSQKAVTDALSDAAAGQLSWGAITGDIENQGDLQDALGTKVNKEDGKVLSTNDYSDADKAKLTSLEGSHFRGVYINEAALSEISDPVAGDYADVDSGVGADIMRYIYDASDDKWVTQESASSLTASQVKQLYESNADTNAFTDDDKSKLTALKTTVPQAEAEAGTSTNIRAWTAQRVRQAITAWWDTIGTAFGKTLLGSTDAEDARQNLGLGTTATRNVGTSDGQVPEFASSGGLGGFGYGRVGTPAGRYADVNDVPKRTGSYLLTDGHPNSTNNKAPLAGFYDTAILRISRESINDFVDLYLPYHQYSNGMVIAPHTSGGYAPQRIVSDSINLRTSTGNSTIYPMSQKAVTDALALKLDKTDVAQESGQSTTKVMSQKAVTEALKDFVTSYSENVSIFDYGSVDAYVNREVASGINFVSGVSNSDGMSLDASVVVDWSKMPNDSGALLGITSIVSNDPEFEVLNYANVYKNSQGEKQVVLSYFNDSLTYIIDSVTGKSFRVGDSDTKAKIGFTPVDDDDIASVKYVKDNTVAKVQVKEIVTANKTLTAADSGKLLIINADGITITMPANSDFNVDIAKMYEEFTTIAQCAGTDKFREGTATISIIRDVSITNTGIAGKEWLAIGAYEA